MHLPKKQSLYDCCKEYLQKRYDAIDLRLKDINDSLSAETKSSVGDKYETGRAMLHLEKEKQMVQLSNLEYSNKLLQSIDPDVQNNTVQAGAFVKTSKGNFYIAIGAGKLSVEAFDFYAITLSSPIGKILFNKTKGDKILFRGIEYIIEEIL